MQLSRMLSRRTYRSGLAGFGMIEVLVTLIVVAVGLLGLAGMQALAISNTAVARMRSIAALQAQSLAAAIGANPAYWSVSNSTLFGTSGTGLTVLIRGAATNTATTVTATPSTAIPGYTDCTVLSASCSAQQMAAYDLAVFGQNLFTSLGAGSTNTAQGNATISCPVPTGNPIPPVACTVTIFWTEKNLAANQASGSVAQLPVYDYSVVIQP